jgi:hypothetical protein
MLASFSTASASRTCLIASIDPTTTCARETTAWLGVVGLELGNVVLRFAILNIRRTRWIYGAFSYQRLFAGER